MLSPTFPAVHLPFLETVPLPHVQRVRLPQPTAERVGDLDRAVREELGKSLRLRRLPKGASVAVAVGSRGVAEIATLARATVGWLEDQGHSPFIVPAMGTHGGANAACQRALLAKLGVTPEVVGCPIRATMETVDYGTVAAGIPCCFDAEAARADAVVLLARVKSHTSFDRPIESGLTKMVAVGLGKAEGARNVHRLGVRGLGEILPLLARRSLDKSPIAYGIAVVESGRHEIVALEGVEPESFFATDERLLERAKGLLARLPFKQIDALVCEWVGKEISGAGMDYGVIGRTDIRGVANPLHIFINKIAVLGVTAESVGNGIGIGVADYVPKALVDGLDLMAVYMNAVSATFIEKARIPIVLATEQDAIRALVATSWAPDPANVRYCQIRSTLHLDEVLVSEPLYAEIRAREGVEAVGEPMPLAFDEAGRLLTRV
jgi:hypothetical protein